MIAPAIPRWIAAILNHETTGVNALLPAVPRDVDEVQPPPVRIHNVVDNATLARGQREQGSVDEWALSIRIAEEVDLAMSPAARGSLEDLCTVMIELDGIVADAENDVALRDSYRVLRAVRRSLTHAFRALGNGSIKLEQQLVTPADRMTMVTYEKKKGSGLVSVAVLCPFTLRDPWASLPISET